MISAFGVEHGEVSKVFGYGNVVGSAVKESKRLAGSAKLGRQGRLLKREELGRAFKATGGLPRHSESRPGPWLPQSRKAWDKGYHSG
jgi:hypothetical protein